MPRAEALSAHLRHCPGCRRYLEEMSAVAGAPGGRWASQAGVGAVSLLPSQTTRAPEERGTPSAWAVLSARLNWRLALPALGAAVLLLLMLSPLPHPGVLTPPVRVSHLAAPPPTPARDLSPTMANYERAAGGSSDEFDDLLTQQALQHLPSAPNFNATFAPSAGASRLSSPVGDHPRSAERCGALWWRRPSAPAATTPIPEGIVTSSPGLRGTSYPGKGQVGNGQPDNGVVGSDEASWSQPRSGWGLMARFTPGSSCLVTRGFATNPFGIRYWFRNARDNRVAGGGMGIQRGAVCHMSPFSAGVRP